MPTTSRFPVLRPVAAAALAAVSLAASVLASPCSARADEPPVHLSPSAGDRLQALVGSEALLSRLPPGGTLSSLAVEGRRVVVIVALPGGANARVVLAWPDPPGTAPGAWFARSLEPDGLSPDVAAPLRDLGDWLDASLPDDPWVRPAPPSPPGAVDVANRSANPPWTKVVALVLAALQLAGMAVLLAIGVWRITGPAEPPGRPGA